MTSIQQTDPEIAAIIVREEARQKGEVNLIASENIVSDAVLAAQGSVLTNKYAEGYPGRRYYGGCEVVDEAEEHARSRACELFGADHANVQAHSGTQANIAAYSALISPGDPVLAMDLAHGGHLSHGAKVSLTGKIYNFHHYPVSQQNEMIDLDLVRKMAHEVSPALIVAGASAYPRVIDFAGFRSIADEVGAHLMVDMAHIAGLVAAGVHPSPVPHADVVTTTTHKTLRGPRSGLILCRKKWRKKIDSAVFPGGQGGPLMHQVAARAVCFREAMTDSFRDYARQVVENSVQLGEILSAGGLRLVSGGTDNHMILADLRSMDLTGDIAEAALGRAGIVVNMNMIPYDPAPPRRPSGMRIGTPTVTSRGMGTAEITSIGEMILEVLGNPQDENRIEGIRAKVREMCEKFPTRI
ncbi:MAG: serine hydroxymethyltransferase [Planctomycetes bacterium]|jgi:glycine hydroxymethyltransferase|nr:serine hydroxymethyltransferase [Planctomycetota bacterium]MBT6452686.1 serine hydroxymethyltransferase [Planctomycetota bacterium]MBT6540431.1 serine hydroxymethyltransferase [Planctomycetota bacterium]MBT6785076.1 serine hydroxymethyltransferase [Planctomycetota bacterium]MBT6967420.1 serine hydroxymethyltransferase [Planctomycetota bacterium]